MEQTVPEKINWWCPKLFKIQCSGLRNGYHPSHLQSAMMQLIHNTYYIPTHRPIQRILTSYWEVSLYNWHPVLLAWNQLICLCWISNRFSCLVKIKAVKQVGCCRWYLPLWSKLVFTDQFMGHGNMTATKRNT